MKKIHILLAVAASLAATGCNDFLDRAPYDEVSSKSVFSTPSLAESVVVGAYSNLRADYNSTTAVNYDAFSSVMDPGDIALSQRYTYLAGTIQSNNDFFADRWKRLYEGINRANDVINNMGSVPEMSDELKAQRIAECKFIRAYEYYLLNCCWRGVPIYLQNLADAEYTKPRSTEEEVWQQCIDDLTDAIDCESLPDKYAANSADWGRVTKGAAYVLRAKVYMWLKRWHDAEMDLRKVGELGYKLYNGNYADLFTEANEHCDEMIFSITMTELAGMGNVFSSTYGTRATTGYGHSQFYLNHGFIDSFEYTDGKPFSWDDVIEGYSAMSPKKRSVFFLRDNMTSEEYANMQAYGADMSQYLETGNEARIAQAYVGRDPRLAAIAITPSAKYVGGSTGADVTYTLRFPFRTVSAPTFDIQTELPTNCHYLIRKFVTVGTKYKNLTFNPVDVPVFRYAGVLLDLAECLNEQDKTNDAIPFINQVRERAGVAPLNQPGNDYVKVTGKDDMRRRIYREQKWELATEGVLYFEELRHGTWKDDKFYAGNGVSEAWGEARIPYRWREGYDKWAVPRAEIDKNSNLTQNPQWF